MKLRATALGAAEQGLPAPPSDHAHVSGVVIDIPRQGGTATLVAMTDNTTSLYTSTGGGTLGTGNHAAVAAATHALLSAVERQLESFQDADDGSLPPAGVVRVHVLTPSGERRATDLPEDSFWGRSPHALVPVIAAAQNVISKMCEVSPQ